VREEINAGEQAMLGEFLVTVMVLKCFKGVLKWHHLLYSKHFSGVDGNCRVFGLYGQGFLVP
jgi:hypothetical protein